VSGSQKATAIGSWFREVGLPLGRYVEAPTHPKNCAVLELRDARGIRALCTLMQAALHERALSASGAAPDREVNCAQHRKLRSRGVPASHPVMSSSRAVGPPAFVALAHFFERCPISLESGLQTASRERSNPILHRRTG
jgi:hypothetical protein